MKRIFMLLLVSCQLSAQVTFTKITDPANPAVTFTNTAGNYKGASWIDLNQDQYPDLFVSQKFLFKNLGNGNFEQMADVAGVTLGQAASGGSWGDINNDGKPDCISASVVSGLHMNVDGFTFSLKNDRLPGFENYRAWDCSLVDADNNGLLDLFWAHADNFPPGSVQQPCKLYLQVMPDSFQLVSGYEFSEQFKPYTIPVWSDYDLDGDQDLFIGSGPGGTSGPDYCYKNLKSETGSFAMQRLTDFPFSPLQDGQVYNMVDYDNDGDLDICLTNYAGAKTRFYKLDAGSYVETATPFTVQGPYLTNAWADLDNDGDQDVIISSDGNANVRVYKNNGGVFSTVQNVGAAENGICGVAFADYDNDGDLDIYTNGATTARALFRNDSPTLNNWVQFSLVGVQSNRSAIGTTIRIKSIINGVSTWQIRQISARNSFQSQHDLRQHFGLGNAVAIDSLIVAWPSGVKQHFASLSANHFYRLVENQTPEVLSVATHEPEIVQFFLSPNPAKFGAEIKAEKTIDWVMMYDTSGRIVNLLSNIQNNSSHVEWPREAKPGIYYLKVGFEDGTFGIQKLAVY
ncbi:MAG: VCBS repeat-containing protein [Saprospiraceae bacterium]|nr:VCBS repeat-containing protein [Saprospiraceae bacterium]